MEQQDVRLLKNQIAELNSKKAAEYEVSKAAEDAKTLLDNVIDQVRQALPKLEKNAKSMISNLDRFIGGCKVDDKAFQDKKIKL